ncbi:receptor-interacting serine/threonine-protein kinase 4-like [Haliotis cracherodii]|uniref:receptor-interacting serine/threonine-protein kinase 4-like n=1 Tax=Haliotis cracherodii TaxID=6455 RepID=UPI0039EC3407
MSPSTADCRNLHHASEIGALRTVEQILLRTGVNILNCRVGGTTPLKEAAEEGYRDILELLLSKGADVSLVGDDCDTILHLACYGGDIGTVKYILSLNAVDFNKSRGMKNRTPVMVAAYPGNRKVVNLLVTKGADVSLVDDYGDTILHLACRGGNVSTVRFLLSLNVVDIDARNKKGRIAAAIARNKGHRPAALTVPCSVISSTVILSHILTKL